MAEEQKKSENWYRPALVFYAKTTGWIIVPLVVAIILLKYIQLSVGSQIWFFIAVIIAFIVTCFGIYREVKIYKQEVENTPLENSENKINGN